MVCGACGQSKFFWVAASAVLAFYLFNLGIYFDFTADDPGITFRYGANLFDGRGLVYNAGERVEGYSNFGEVLLSGLVYKLLSPFGDARGWLLFAMKLINLLAGVVTGILTYRFCVDVLGRDRWLALLTVMLLAANGAFIINVSSPLETATYTMVTAMTMYSLARYLNEPSARGWGALPAVASAGAAMLIWRIDSPALFAACGASLLIARRFRLQRRDWFLIGIWALVFLAYTGFRLAWFGDIVNNPYHAKVAARIGWASPLTLPYVTGFFSYLGGHVIAFLALLALVLYRAPRLYLLPCALILVQWFYIALVNGDWMPAYRFWAVVVPCVCLVITGVLDFPWPRVSAPVQRFAKATLVLLAAGYWFTSAPGYHRADHETPFKFYRGLRTFTPRSMNPYGATADWLNAHVSKEALIAVQEAGFMPFLTGLKTIDTYGLCNPQLARMPGARNRLGLKLRWDPSEPGTQYILSRKPDVLVVGPTRDWAYAPQRFLGNYVLAASPQEGINVFRREDSQRVR